MGDLVKVEFRNGPSVAVRLRHPDSPSGRALVKSVPFLSRASVWGHEVYFEAPFHVGLEPDARAEMDVGDVAFWPEGDAIAIFFGRTPISIDDRPRAYSPCNILGKVEGDVTVLTRVRQGQELSVSAI